MAEQKFPPQHQERQPGIESQMHPQPQDAMAAYRGSGKLQGKTALITGGDSGIGRAVAVAFAKEGAAVAVGYLSEHGDAEKTRTLVEAAGGRCLLLAFDVGDEAACRDAVERTCGHFGQLDVLVNNAAEQHPQEDIAALSAQQIERTFRTNVFSMFYLSKAAGPRLAHGGCIINTTSVTAYRGSDRLIDYSSTKGAIVSFTRSLAKALVKQGIRVNAVAPGPVWTPLIPASFDAESVPTFGGHAPMGRAGQPDEIAPCYVFLASADSAYMSGQVLHPNGGEIVNG